VNARRRDYSGRTAFVTGAGSGLGRAIALRFAAAGARIVAMDREPSGLESLQAELTGRGNECLATPGDVTDAGSCAAAVGACVARFGSLDVLVNNAGISHRSAFAATGLDVIRRVMEVNFFGAVYCTKSALPHLVTARGQLITISSVAGYAPLIARTGYAASKHALHGFLDSLRSELESQGVDVMIVCPSFVATHIDVNALGGDGAPVRHGQVTVGRPLAPEVVADMIFEGAARRRRLLLVGRTAHQAWWLSRFAPRLYERIMSSRLHAELDGP
jgi:NAD(P)-dependent dehydrogenase (short-subunit alcohol dehydrogenase family)